MITNITVPRHDVNDTHVIVARWKVVEGARVTSGQEVCVVETSKTAMPIDAERDGYLGIACAEGEYVEVGRTIGWLADALEELSAARSSIRAPVDEQRVITHKARDLAERLGIALDDLPQRGVIREKDVREVASRRELQRSGDSTASRGPSLPDVSPDLIDRVVSFTPAQATAARRVMESMHAAAPAYLSMEVSADAALQAVERLSAERDQAVRFNDLVIRAVATALPKFPAFNAFVVNSDVHYYKPINIGIVMDADGTLVVPVITDADRKDVVDVARESAILQMKAFRKQLTAAECSGGTFTITNLSAFGVTDFIPVIYSRQSAILSVAAPISRGVLLAGQWCERRFVRLGLTYDHRLHSGVSAAQFLGRVKTLMESGYEPSST